VTTPGARLGYRDVLQLPHASRLLLAALIGRLSFATVSLAMLLAVQRSTRSYAAAGAAVGAFGLANVLVAPARARLVDRAGQPVALPRLAAGYAALLCLLAGLTSSTTVASWLLVTTAGLAGLFPPPLGAAMRVLWASLVQDPAMLARAYSLDAVAEELLFVTGPLLVGLTAAVAPPALGLIASAGLALAGSLAPGLRPCGFHSPYEAAAWAVLSQRTRIVQAAGLRDDLLRRHGQAGAFPAPQQLRTLELDLPGRKSEYLHAVTDAALDGLLDSSALRSVDPGQAILTVQQVKGLGPFGAELVVRRGANAPDVLPGHERRLDAEIAERYGAGHTLSAVSELWRPFRTWASVHLRALREQRTHETTLRAPTAA